MRCPSCHDEYEHGVRRCAACRVPLVADDGSTGNAAPLDAGAHVQPAATGDALLGRFHPLVAERVSELLFRRGVEHTSIEHDDEVEIRVEVHWRDDLRTELALTWDDVVDRLDTEGADDVRAGGGHAPGWFDAPQGGHIDRAGRLVVESDAADDDDAARVVGPALLTLGAILGVVGWYVLDAPSVTILGVGLALLGVFMPR